MTIGVTTNPSLLLRHNNDTRGKDTKAESTHRFRFFCTGGAPHTATACASDDEPPSFASSAPAVPGAATAAAAATDAACAADAADALFASSIDGSRASVGSAAGPGVVVAVAMAARAAAGLAGAGMGVAVGPTASLKHLEHM